MFAVQSLPQGPDKDHVGIRAGPSPSMLLVEHALLFMAVVELSGGTPGNTFSAGCRLSRDTLMPVFCEHDNVTQYACGPL